MPKVTRSEKNKKKHQEITNEKIKTKSNFIFRLFLMLILIISIFFIYCRYTETSGLIVNEYKVTSNKIPDTFHGIKIVQFSDIHYGTTVDLNYLKSIVRRINELKPDIVLFTGDLIFENYKIDNDTMKDITNELSKINTTIAKYACIGNEDYNNEQYNIIMKDSRFTILNNTFEKVYYQNEDYIIINGIGSLIKNDVNTSEAFNFKEENKYILSMTHEANNIHSILEYKPDMIVSGHTLGGQIRLPVLGGVIKQESSNQYNKKHETVDKTEIFNSYGIGTSQIRFRFLNKPSINLYRMTKK